MKHSDEICNRLLARDQRIAEDRAVKQKQFKRADTLCSPLLPLLPAHVLMLAEATCAAEGGAGGRILAERCDGKRLGDAQFAATTTAPNSGFPLLNKRASAVVPASQRPGGFTLIELLVV